MTKYGFTCPRGMLLFWPWQQCNNNIFILISIHLFSSIPCAVQIIEFWIISIGSIGSLFIATTFIFDCLLITSRLSGRLNFFKSHNNHVHVFWVKFHDVGIARFSCSLLSNYPLIHQINLGRCRYLLEFRIAMTRAWLVFVLGGRSHFSV